MIPDNDQLSSIASLEKGDLGEIPFAVVLHAMAAHGRSGVLEIERKPMRKMIVLEHGVPVDCRSNLVHETLTRFMIGQGQLTAARGQELVAAAAREGLRVGEVLIREKVLTASELYKVLQQNLARKLLDGFTWRSGAFRMSGQLPQVDSPLKVNAPQLVLTGISRFTADEEVNHAIGPLVGKKLFLHPTPPFPLSQIRLGNAQQQIVERLGGGKRIDELAAETPIPFDQIMRLVYSLAVIGIVVPQDWMPKEAPRVLEAGLGAGSAFGKAETAALRAAPGPAATGTVDEDDQALDRDELMEAFLKHRQQDAFDLLDLEETATLVDARQAFLVRCRAIWPWRHRGDLREKAEDLLVAYGQAFGELCDVERRNQLVRRRQTLREEQKKRPAADRFAIQSDLLDPATQFAKGKALMEAGRYREAIEQLAFAYDCDPQNSEYRAELAFCRFLAHPESEGERALDALKETLRIDPSSGLAVYYRGRVETELGLFAEAEQHLQAALKLLRGDRRPIEALKDLQTRSKSRKRRLFGG
ncbi:MAG: DUF4388 domain-containing protein [Acidobacteriota bacterium]